MEGIKTYNDLSQIPELDYEGYIWYSDTAKPILAKAFDFKSVGINPFIQEALLFCKEKDISVMVRHTGKYHISEFDLNALISNGAELGEEKKYYPHRLDIGDKKVCIRQLWIPEKDENCGGMEVLTLRAHIFTGFKND